MDSERLLVEKVLGEPPPTWARSFLRRIDAIGMRIWDVDISSIVLKHWAGAGTSQALRKIRFLACQTYATGVYATLLFSERRPAILTPITTLDRFARLDAETLARIAESLVSTVGRVTMREETRRITRVGAFVAAIDHAFDHELNHLPPKDRGEFTHAILDRRCHVQQGIWRFVIELQSLMERNLQGEPGRRYAAAIARCHDWVDAEVKSLLGLQDPEGAGFRRAGVEGVIDGLIHPVSQYIDEYARQWMYQASMFIQILDDWIDRDADRAANRPTPAVRGEWTLETVEHHWLASLAGIERVAQHSGLHNDSIITLAQEVYRAAIWNILQAMTAGTAN